MDGSNPTTSGPRNIIDWDTWRRGWNGAKRRGQQTEGPCPVTGEGENACHVRLDAELAGCRKCGDGAGKLTGDQLVEHARAAGAVMVDLGAASRAWESWKWSTADGRERRQFRTPDGRKKWELKNPPPGGWPAPAELLYLPAGVPSGPGPVYACEGASDTDAAVRLGLRAIGRNNARPSAASLVRLDTGAVFRVWPDVDDDQAGYRQAVTWADAATAAGLTVEAIDPLKLRPDAPPGYDARNWIAELPDGATANTAALDAAVVDVDAIKARIPAAPAETRKINPASMAPVETGNVPAVLADIVPRDHVRLCDSERQIADLIADTAAGRLSCILEETKWYTWQSGNGWRLVETPALRAAVTLAGRANLGQLDRNGEARMRPATGGRAATAAGVLRILEGLPGIETHAVDWDSDPALVGLPNGEILNLATGERLAPQLENRIRRRLGAMPATAAEYERSQFRRVVEHVIPDPEARTFLQRRLGAALQNAEGLDHLISLHGPGGSGKGSLMAAIRAVFGMYESGIPTPEILTGGRRSHTAWKARLGGVRLMTLDDLPVGRDLDTAVIKELVGGRLNGVQFMGREFFDLTIHAPILTAGNAPPSVPGMDSGTERRLVPIQCGPPVANPDPTVRESMRTAAERGACLTWLIEGGIEYRAAGCPVPAAAREAAAEVGRESPIGEFTAQWVSRHGVERRLIGEIFGEWQTFMKAAGRPPGGKNRLSSELVAAGWIRSRIQGMSGLIPPMNASEQRPAAIGGASGASGATPYPTHRRSESDHDRDRLGGGTEVRHLAPLAPPGPADEFPAYGLGRADGGAGDQGVGGAAKGAENSEADPMTAPPPEPALLAKMEAAATAAGAELVRDAAGKPIWWRESDGSIHVAVETPAPPLGDPDPSGDACSRCGRPWSPATGPGFCTRCDGGVEWDDDDRERRLRRLDTRDLRVLVAALPEHGGRDAELTIIRDELDRRCATESDGARVH